MHSNSNGFSSLDFDEARMIAAIVQFDIMEYAKKLRSCGPGCDYYAKDKRYFITMLVQHISTMMEAGEAISPEAASWYKKAQQTVAEYRAREQHHLRIRRG